MPMCQKHKYRSTVTATFTEKSTSRCSPPTERYEARTRSDLCLKCLEDLLNAGQIRDVHLAGATPPGIP